MPTFQGAKVFRNKKEQRLFAVINVHAPHMGITQSNEKKQIDEF